MALKINDTAARRQYTATAGQTSFAVPFTFFANSELRVFNGETELTYAASPASASQFSITGANNDLGGSITLGAPGATLNDVITVVHDVPVERLTDFPLSGPFQIESLNIELAKIVAMIRQMSTSLGRVITLSISDTGSDDLQLPPPSERANTCICFDENGNLQLRPAPGSNYYSFGFFFIAAANASEVLCLHVAAEPFTIPANFGSPNSLGSCGTNPAASFAIDVQRNGVTIGTITISTGGAFTFATTGGTAKAIAAGDVLKFVGPASPGTCTNVAITIRGPR